MCSYSFFGEFDITGNARKMTKQKESLDDVDKFIFLMNKYSDVDCGFYPCNYNPGMDCVRIDDDGAFVVRMKYYEDIVS